jgi:hypothetical protein
VLLCTKRLQPHPCVRENEPAALKQGSAGAGELFPEH